MPQRYFRDHGQLTPLGAKTMAERLATAISGVRAGRPAS
jgi:hypothetical protein